MSGKIRMLASTGAGATGHAAYQAAIATMGCDQRPYIARSHMTQVQAGSWALQARFASIPCRGQPVCALVLALRAD